MTERDAAARRMSAEQLRAYMAPIIEACTEEGLMMSPYVAKKSRNLPLPEHGTWQRYRHHTNSCVCDLCRAANKQKARDDARR